MLDKTHESMIPLLDNEAIREKATDELKQKGSITNFLNRIADDFIGRDQAKVGKWVHRTERYRRYTMSDHNGQVNDDGSYEDFEGKTERPYYFDAKLNTNNAAKLPQWMQSYPRIDGEPRHEQTIKNKRLAAAMVKEFADWLQKPRFLLKKQREIETNLLPHGNTYRYTYLNTDKPIGYVAKTLTEEKELTTERKGEWSCVNCKATGIKADLMDNKCPQCQAETLEIHDDPAFKVKAKTDQTEQIPIFDVDYEVPDASEVRVIWTSDNIHEALAVVWDTKVPRCVLQGQYPDIPIKSKAESEDSTEDSEADEVPYQRFWINPYVYANFTTDQIESLLLENGEVELPIDAEVLKELFQTGIFFARTDKTILDMYEQSIAECWTHCAYQPAKTGYGVGDWDMLEYQYQKNEMRTNRINSAMGDDTTPLMFDNNVYPAGEFPNHAGATIGIPLPSGKSLNDVAQRVQAGTPPMNSIALDEQLDADMQSRAGSMTTGTSSAPDMKAIQNTATAYMAHQNQAMERQRPLLKRMAVHLDLEQFFQYWEIKQNYWSLAMFEQEYSDYPAETVKWLKEADIRNDFNWFVVPDSFMPKTKETKQSAFINWVQTPSAQLAMQDPAKAKEIARYSDEIFDAPDLDEKSEEQTEAQLRLDVVIEEADKLETLQNMAGVGIRENGFISMQPVYMALEDSAKKIQVIDQPGEPFAGLPLDVLLDDHDEFIDVYQDYLRSPPGRKLKELAYAALKELIVLHSQAVELKQQYIQAKAMQTQQRMMEQQNEFMRVESAKDAEIVRGQQLQDEEEDFARGLVADQIQQEVAPPEQQEPVVTAIG